MKTWQYLLTLIAATFLVYLPSFGNQFIWDDEQFIYRNQYVQDFNISKILTTNTIAGAGENSNYYRPLTTLSFAIDYQLWGDSVAGFHFTNTLLHSLAGIMLFLFLIEIGIGKKTSFWIALIFLLHPIQTEAVGYINSRGDSWYATCGLASLYLFTRIINQRPIVLRVYQSQITLNLWAMMILSALLYLGSILGKEIGIAIFGLMMITVLFQLIPLYRHKYHRLKKLLAKQQAAIVTLITSFLFAVSYLLGRATILNFANSFNFYNGENLYASSLLVRLLTFTKIFFIYLQLLIFPYPLHMERFTDLVTSFSTIWPWMFLMINLVTLILAYYEWQKKKSLLIIFGWSWFFIMLAPVSGIIPINGLLYEHWLYLPMVGPLITLLGIARLLSTLTYRRLIKVCQPIMIGVIILFAGLTIRQNYLWGNPIRFYSYLLQHTGSARIHNNLAMALSDAKRYDEALTQYQLAINNGTNYPQVYHNRGNVYRDLGEFEAATADYRQAIQIDPNFYYSYNSLIALYFSQEKYQEALKEILVAQNQFPNSTDYKLMEVEVLLKDNRFEEASEKIKKYQLEITDQQIQSLLQSWLIQAQAIQQDQK